MSGINQPIYPAQVASYDATLQQADIFPKVSIYKVPPNQAGIYRVSGYGVITQAASTSSNLPQILFTWTDEETGVQVEALFVGTTTVNTIGSGSSTNGALSNPSIIRAKAGTSILLRTNAYASSGATPMQFSLHAKVEYLGP